jgi:hypothetical protein
MLGTVLFRADQLRPLARVLHPVGAAGAGALDRARLEPVAVPVQEALGGVAEHLEGSGIEVGAEGRGGDAAEAIVELRGRQRAGSLHRVGEVDLVDVPRADPGPRPLDRLGEGPRRHGRTEPGRQPGRRLQGLARFLAGAGRGCCDSPEQRVLPLPGTEVRGAPSGFGKAGGDHPGAAGEPIEEQERVVEPEPEGGLRARGEAAVQPLQGVPEIVSEEAEETAARERDGTRRTPVTCQSIPEGRKRIARRAVAPRRCGAALEHLEGIGTEDGPARDPAAGSATVQKDNPGKGCVGEGQGEEGPGGLDPRNGTQGGGGIVQACLRSASGDGWVARGDRARNIASRRGSRQETKARRRNP